jgi:AcrR family transcriptional regulator
MEQSPSGPTGLARRSRRLSDRETRERMMRAALEMVASAGLSVSLEHISFEDVIRDADVARSTAYRHWPHKDLFFSDLIVELATHTDLAIVTDEIALAKQVLAEHTDWLGSPQQRHRLILELIRRVAVLDFESVLNSPRWRTYLALHATFSSLTDGALRARVQTALAEAEAGRTAQIAAAWRRLAALFGYRLRPELDTSFEALAILLSASLRGLVISALANPGIAEQRTVANPFGAAGKEAWSLPAISLASIATAFLEPDPASEWTEGRKAEIHRALDAFAP